MTVTSSELTRLAVIAGTSGAAVALLVARLLISGLRAREARSDKDRGLDSDSDRPSRPTTPALRPAEDRMVCSSELVQKFVLTGGPCGGKTTALARLREFFEERGFRVFIAPEAATTLWSNGMSLSDLKSSEDGIAFQIKLMDMQMFFEDTFFELAERTGQRSVVLCDRAPGGGTMDGKAYSSDAEWAQVVAAQGMDELELRDSRYNAVLHLTTAANGAESFYLHGAETPRTAAGSTAVARTPATPVGRPGAGIRDGEARRGARARREDSYGVARPPAPRRLPQRRGRLRGQAALADRRGEPAGGPARHRAQGAQVPAPPRGAHQAGARRGGHREQDVHDREVLPALPRLQPDRGHWVHLRAPALLRGGLRVLRRDARRGARRREDRDEARAQLARVRAADGLRRHRATPRTCFNVGNLSLYIERFLTPHAGLQMLYVQAEKEVGAALLEQLPPGVRAAVDKEVTGDPRYSAYHLSLRREESPASFARGVRQASFVAKPSRQNSRSPEQPIEA